MTATWRWDDASRVISNDPRFKCLKTNTERKAAFNSFMDDVKSRDRTEARLRRQQVSEPIVTSFSNARPSSSF